MASRICNSGLQCEGCLWAAWHANGACLMRARSVPVSCALQCMSPISNIERSGRTIPSPMLQRRAAAPRWQRRQLAQVPHPCSVNGCHSSWRTCARCLCTVSLRCRFPTDVHPLETLHRSRALAGISQAGASRGTARMKTMAGHLDDVCMVALRRAVPARSTTSRPSSRASPSRCRTTSCPS